MRFVVTGATGTLGRYVVNRLRDSGHDVLGLSRTGAGGHTATDYSVESLSALFQGADGVVDLAAARPRPDERLDLATTVVTAGNVLEAACRAWVRTLVQASSVAVYGPEAPRPLHEASPTRPRSPYALGKLTVERWARLDDYVELRTVSLRLSHLIGLGDDSGSLVSTYLRRATAGENLEVHEPLGPARGYLYAGDAARAVELALCTETAGGAVNVAGPHLLTPAQLAQVVSEEVGGSVVGGDPAWRHAPWHSTADEVDTTRAREALGFAPEHDVRTALQEIRQVLDRQAVSEQVS